MLLMLMRTAAGAGADNAIYRTTGSSSLSLAPTQYYLVAGEDSNGDVVLSRVKEVATT